MQTFNFVKNLRKSLRKPTTPKPGEAPPESAPATEISDHRQPQIPDGESRLPSWPVVHCAGAVHYACGWRDAAPDPDRLQSLHARHGVEILSLDFKDDVWTVAQQPLMTACMTGRDVIVEILVAWGADPNYKRPDGLHCLMEAAIKGFASTCKLLLDACAIADASTESGQTALRLAIREQKSNVVETLLENGASFDLALKSPHKTAEFQRGVVVQRQLLQSHLERSGDKDALTSLNDIVETTLSRDVHLACGWKGRDADIEELHRLHHEFGRAILDLTFEDDDWPAMRPLRTAASAGHQECVERLISWGADVDHKSAHGSTALHEAAFNGRSRACQALIGGGAGVDQETNKGQNALTLALKNGNANTVQVLLENGASLQKALQRGAEEEMVVRLKDVLLSSLEKINDRESIEVVREICRRSPGFELGRSVHEACGWRGAKVDLQKLTDLHYKYGDEVLGVFYADDAWPTKKPPLMTAAVVGSYNAAKQLIQWGADVQAKDADGVTALHCAAANGHSFTCQLLLDEGAVVDDVTANHQTALHLAIRHQRRDSVRVLRLRGASVHSAENCQYQHEEFLRSFDEMKELLEDH